MANSLVTSPVHDDDILWTEYLKEASTADARMVKDWTKVLDVLLVFVALFSSVLTAFIIETSGNFQPDPAGVTNKILIAIYNRTMNDSAPIDLEQFLRLDNASIEKNLAIAIVVAALAMAAKLWLVSYSREVTTSGPPRVRAKRRQEVYGGLLAWKLAECIDGMPLMIFIAVVLFAIFIFSSTLGQANGLAYLFGGVLLAGISFIVVVSFSAAFIYDSPYGSPFSNFINFIFRVFPNKSIHISEQHGAIRLRTIGVFLFAVIELAAGGYFVMKQNYIHFPCIFAGIACVFALMRKGQEAVMQPRLFSLALWALFSSVVIFICFALSSYFAINHSTTLSIFVFVLSSILLCLYGYIGTKMSETRPMVLEAEAVAWLLETSSNRDPTWFEKAVQIAKQSPHQRALLLGKLLPLLVPLIISLPKEGDVTFEQAKYISTLANLMDYTPRKKAFWRNEASLERPDLPKELIDRLEKLQTSSEKCSHKRGNNQEKRNDGTVRCAEACLSDAVEHILQLHGTGMMANLEFVLNLNDSMGP